MTQPTETERRTLSTFFSCAAPHHGFYDRATRDLKAESVEEPVFQKNLLLLREMLSKSDLSHKRIQELSRFAMKERRRVNWVTELVANAPSDSGDLERNLLWEGSRSIHRLVTAVTVPVTRVGFGTGRTASDGQIAISRSETFTMNDLIGFFCRSFEIERTRSREKAILGAMNYLLLAHTLDEILFAIDFAAGCGARVRTPLQLQDHFIQEAADEVNARLARRPPE